MTSLGESGNSGITENHIALPFNNEGFNSEFDVNDSEAKEINSCLNFLSILDDESSDDSCEYTLFRKKDDVTSSNSNTKGDTVSTDNKILTEGQSDLKEIVRLKSEYTTPDNESKLFEENQIKNNLNLKVVNDINKKNPKVQNIDENKIYEINCTSSKLHSATKGNKSPDFIVNRSIPKIFKISQITNSSISNSEATSRIRSGKNIVLKVPTIPSKLNYLSSNENKNRNSRQLQNSSKNDKIIVKISTSKQTNDRLSAIKFESSNMVRRNPIYYARNNSITPKNGANSTVATKSDGTPTVNYKVSILPKKTFEKNHIKSEKSRKHKFIESYTGHPDSPQYTPVPDTNLGENHLQKRCQDDIIEENIEEAVVEDIEKKVPVIEDIDEKIPVTENIENKIMENAKEKISAIESMEENIIENIKEDIPLMNKEENIIPTFPELDSKTEISDIKKVAKIDDTNDENKDLLISQDIELTKTVEKSASEDEIQSKDTINPVRDDSSPITDPNKERKENNSDSELSINNIKLKKVHPNAMIKTRLLAGAKTKKKYNKKINLLKRTPLPDNISTKRKSLEKGLTNKYKPLPRTELPTFMKKMDSNEETDLEEPNISSCVIPDSDKIDETISDSDSLNKNATDSVHKNKKIGNKKSFENESKDKMELDTGYGPELKQKTFVQPLCLEDNQVPEEKGGILNCAQDLNKLIVPEQVKDLENNTAVCILSSKEDLQSTSCVEVPASAQMVESPIHSVTFEEIDIKHKSEDLVEFKDTFLNSEHLVETSVTTEPISVALPLQSNPVPTVKGEASQVLSSNGKGNKVGVKNKPIRIAPKYKTEKENESSSEPKSPIIAYSYNKASSLSFSIQNILENMFKHESFPSSTNMARLAKLMKVQWKDVRDWFVARRNLNKKNGFFSRDQPLTSCPYCRDYECHSGDRAIVHLLSKEHIENMIIFMEKDNLIFSKFQNAHTKEDENKETEIEKAPPNIEYNCSPVTSGASSLSPQSLLLSKSPPSERERVTTPDPATQNVRKSIEPPTSITTSHFVPSPPIMKSAITIDNHRTREEEKGLVSVVPQQMSSSKCVDLYSQRPSSRPEFRRLRHIDKKIFVGYRCPDCAKIFQSEWMLIRHSVSHKKLICSECDEVFLREDLLQDHFKEHIIESMETELCSMYLCLKCYNLNCICAPETQYVSSVRTKHYIRPQVARRSKPFLSPPYSGVNEHLKVTMHDFWHKFNPYERKSFQPVKEESPSGNARKLFKEKKENNAHATESNNKPTYTNITTFNCDICESFFFTEDELKEHIIVHRIQARSRSKRQENEKKSVFLKPAAPIAPVYFCSYCVKGYRKEKSLCNHFKFECQNLPKKIALKISGNRSFEMEKAGRNNHYKIKLKNHSPPRITNHTLNPPKVKCKNCSLEFLEGKDLSEHLSNCSIKHSVETLPSHSETEGDDYYFICKYCSIPAKSEKDLSSHLSQNCHNAPKTIQSEVASNNGEHKRLGKGVHYKKVERDKVTNLLSPNMLRSIFDISTFAPLKTNYKRVKCKFCDKCPLKSCLKLHMLSQCKRMPQEIQIFLLRNKHMLSEKYMKRSHLKHSKPVPKPLKTCDSNVIKSKSYSSPSTSPTKAFTEHPDQCLDISAPNNNMLYDCHLCEEKFKLSKDFISHMSNFHCMIISEDSSSKWLSQEVHRESSTHPNEPASPFKSPQKSLSDESFSEQDHNLESIAETLVVSDYVNMKVVQTNSPSPSKKRKRSVCSLTESPGKSQKMDEDELLGDLDNLDSFIETVQLEDSTFEDSSL